MNIANRLSRIKVNTSLFFKKTVASGKREARPILIALAHHVEIRTKTYSLTLAAAFFALMSLYAVRRNYPFLHDPLYYWRMADSFSMEGRFAFVNFSNNLRGYLFPFLLFLLKQLANLIHVEPKLLFYGYSALLYALLPVYILPWAFHTLFRWKIHLWGRALLGLLLFYFWRDHFLYPFTDFTAITILTVGIALLAHSLRLQHVPLWSLCIGVLIGASLNIRPIYQASLIVLFPFIWLYIARLGILRAFQWGALILLGFGLVLFPQFRINQVHFGVNSPSVLADFDGENLFIKQLFWGLKTQKYEIANDEEYDSIIIAYEDPVAHEIQKTNLMKDKTITGYLRIIRRFPLNMLVSYFRHAFNGLDIFFPSPIVKDVYADHTRFSATNYLVWFLLATHLLRLDLKHLEVIEIFGLLGLLAPVLIAIPTVVEVRFFLPAYLLAYGVIAFGFDYSILAHDLLRGKWEILRVASAGFLWILACFTISYATIAYW